MFSGTRSSSAASWPDGGRFRAGGCPRHDRAVAAEEVVVLGAGLRVAPKQPFDDVFGLVIRVHHAIGGELLLPAHAPRPDRVLHVVDVGLLDVAERSRARGRRSCRRHPEPPADLGRLPLPRLEELRIDRRDPDRRDVHPLLEDRDAVGVVEALVRGDVAVGEVLLRLVAERLGMLEHDAGTGVVREEAGAVLLRREGEAHALAGERHDRVALHPVGAEAVEVEDQVGGEGLRPAGRERVDVHEGAVWRSRELELAAGPSHPHPRGVQRPERGHAAGAVELLLGEPVAAERDVTLDGLAEAHRRHLGVGLRVEDPPGGRCAVPDLPAPGVDRGYDRQRQRPDVLREVPTRGVHRRDREGRVGVDRDTRRRHRPAAEQLLDPVRRRLGAEGREAVAAELGGELSNGPIRPPSARPTGLTGREDEGRPEHDPAEGHSDEAGTDREAGDVRGDREDVRG